MKILFVCSGNSANFDIAPFIKSQGESLKKQGVEVKYFTVKGKGFKGYLSNIARLRKFLIENLIDIIHAHYVLSGWVVVLAATGKPIILSLMGSDAYGEYIDANRIKTKSRFIMLLTKSIQPFVHKIICKSPNIARHVWLKGKVKIIPNGINMEEIIPYENGHKDELDLNPIVRNVLFLGDESNIRKNYKLLKEAYEIIQKENISLVNPYPVSHSTVIKYLNSVDVLVVTSLMEGSPNLVKEAMACNCPVVATDVGDIRWLFGNEPGYFISDFTPEDMALKIEEALAFVESQGKTNGRKRILKLGLDSETVAKRLIEVYEEVLREK